MAVRSTSQELSGLADLIDDFGAPGWNGSRTDEAFTLLRDRWFVLETVMETNAIRMVRKEAQLKPLGVAILPLASSVHQYLFSDLLINAGMYRQAADPNGGHVEFGGQKGDTTRPLLRGAPPKRIESDLSDAFSRLVDRRVEAFHSNAAIRYAARLAATDAAAVFLKDFFGVHPFYDANGRTGRYVASVYLALHGLYVRWAELDVAERKWHRYLNKCLVRRNQVSADHEVGLMRKYEGLLVDFWRPFVESVPEDDAVPRDR